MTDQEAGFATARARLEDIVAQVRKKDTSLEQSLDLLEEGVRLANLCTEHVDQSELRGTAEDAESSEAESSAADTVEPDAAGGLPDESEEDAGGSGEPLDGGAEDGSASEEAATEE